MATRLAIDFHAVEAKHNEIHARLTNWGRWCNGTGGPVTSPMFRLYMPSARSKGAEHSWTANPVDGSDASRVARYVAQLPEKHRRALAWCYIKPINPRRAAQEIGVTLEALALLLKDGRQMLVNRRA